MQAVIDIINSAGNAFGQRYQTGNPLLTTGTFVQDSAALLAGTFTGTALVVSGFNSSSFAIISSQLTPVLTPLAGTGLAAEIFQELRNYGDSAFNFKPQHL